MPTRLLLPAYPILAVLLALAAHDRAAMLRSLAGMTILLASNCTMPN